MLAGNDELVPRRADELKAAMVEAVQRQPDAARAVLVGRGLRRRELLRIAFADLLGRLDVIGVCEAISATTEAVLDAALQAAMTAVAAEQSVDARSVRIAVIAMGRLATGPTPTSCSSMSHATRCAPDPTTSGSPRP
jgi:glutamate-ammonia-ligase adenylyltransferase